MTNVFGTYFICSRASWYAVDHVDVSGTQWTMADVSGTQWIMADDWYPFLICVDRQWTMTIVSGAQFLMFGLL